MPLLAHRTTSKPRDARIDLLRGIAVLVVLLLHFSLTYRLPKGPLGALFTPQAVATVVNNGNYGVTLFFVISGFLITGNSLRRYGTLDRIDRRSFYVMRAARILPPLLLALVLITVLGSLGRPSFVNKVHGTVMPASFMLVAVGSVLTCWHNVLMACYGYFNYALNIYWSLSVEEAFYLVLPLVSTWLRRWALLALALALVVAGPLYRGQHADDEVRYLYGYFACADALAIGCLTAVWHRRSRWRAPVRKAITWIAAGALAVCYAAGIGGHETWGATAVALCTAALLLVTQDGAVRPRSGVGALLDAPLNGLRWMGRHSYELYLYHIVVLGLMRDAVPRALLGDAAQLPWLLLFLVLSGLVAAVVSSRLAVPMNEWARQRWARTNREGVE